jgi:putative heme transporter
MRKIVPLLVAVVIVTTLSIFQRDLLIDIFSRLQQIHPLEAFPLFLAATLMIVARGFFLAACSPGIPLRTAITADQSALSAGYGIALGGGAVGTALRIHMFSRMNLHKQIIAASIVATAVVPSFTTWSLPIVVLLPKAIGGGLEGFQVLVCVVGILLITVSALFWWVALSRPILFSVVGRIGHRLQQSLNRFVPRRYWRTRAFIERADPRFFTDELRISLRTLIKRRRFMILASSLSTLGAGFFCLLIASHVFGAKGLTVYEALVAFSLIRVLIALSPIPGAAGIAELGLIALLERAGVSTLDATGTTLLYRFLTWFIPIVVGTVLWWRYSRLRQETSHGPLHNNDSELEDGGGSLSVHV